MTLAVGSRHHAESHIPRPAGADKASVAAGGIGSGRELAPHQTWIIALVMSRLKHRRHLGDGLVEKRHVIIGLVGTGIARTEHGSQRFTSAIKEAEQRMEAVMP